MVSPPPPPPPPTTTTTTTTTTRIKLRMSSFRLLLSVLEGGDVTTISDRLQLYQQRLHDMGYCKVSRHTTTTNATIDNDYVIWDTVR